MEEGYRVPKLEEFVQGFEFEVKNVYRNMIMDLKTGKPTYGDYTDVWSSCTVYWKKESKWISTKDEETGITISYNQAMDNFFKPFDEKSYIEQELVRVKIK